MAVFLRTTASTDQNCSISDRFMACVRNTGNYFFEDSLLWQLPDVEVIGCLEEIPQETDLLILSMSNFISESTDLGYVHDAIVEKKVQRLVMVGAGAQAYEYKDTIDLSKGTKRFLSLLSERSVSIGVRGYYTAEVLERIGIKNVDVIGCPSAFWKGYPSIDYDAARTSGKPVAIHATPLGHFRDKMSALLAHGMSRGADYILQSEEWLMPLLGLPGCLTDLEYNISYYAFPFCISRDLQVWLKKCIRIFFDMDSWTKGLSKYRFVYGSRFHGNMAAMRAGIPALNMPFDTRTRELCEYLNLPALPLAEFEHDMPLELLIDKADPAMFLATYTRKLGNYTQFLTNNGLTHAFNISQPPMTKSRLCNDDAGLSSLACLLHDLESIQCGPKIAVWELIRQRLRQDRSAASRSAAEHGQIDAIYPPPRLNDVLSS